MTTNSRSALSEATSVRDLSSNKLQQFEITIYAVILISIFINVWSLWKSSIIILSTLIWPSEIQLLSICNLTYLHLPPFTYIWPNLALITIIWSCLPNILDQSDNYSWIYCTNKLWDTESVVTNAVWVFI